MSNLEKKNKYLNGEIILIDKPFGWSSFQTVKKIRYLLKKKYNLKKIKVGHAGTLDPLATGLLILCTGKATKLVEEIQDRQKTYSGEITLGATTPSFDAETQINNVYATKHISEKLIQNVALNFLGFSLQTPPMFSALKKNGERLYKKARRGEKIELKKREIYIQKFKINSISMPKIHFTIECSKGTYIRSIANDFGAKLKSGGYLSKLNREKIGDYSVRDALTIETFENDLKL